MSPPANPRSIITPDAFAVSPALLGIALARPMRRLVAIALDGIMLAILAALGGKLLFTLATGLLLWRTAAPLVGTSQGGLRAALRVGAVFTLTVFLFIAYGRVADALDDDTAEPPAPTVEAGDTDRSDEADINFADLGLTFRDARVLPLIESLSKAPDSAAAAPLADSLARWVGNRPAQSQSALAAGLARSMEDAPSYAAVRAAMAPFIAVDSAAVPDSSATAVLQRQLAAVSAELERVREENEELEEAAEEGFTVRGLIDGASELFGFGFGFSALYFTGFMVLMSGQTPGKKLLGLRVIRLDGRPMSTWIAFERFGGYAASAAIGLLGFAQILWDRNRQGLHDKATETVVIREKNGVPVRPA